MPNQTRSWTLSNELWRAKLFGMAVGGLLVLVGGALAWYIARPTTPWFAFRELRAEYDQERNEIHVTGQYYLDRLCENPTEYMVLSRQVIDERYRVLTSVVPVDQLALEVGLHDYEDIIQLDVPLAKPTVSHVRITALCGGEFPPAVSPPALVNVRQHEKN